MSGHSKWANIKYKKANQDAKRGKIYTKIAREITVAARQGGADPEFNPRLRAAIEKARSFNMPKENIDRAIKRGTGQISGQNFEEVTYEGYGPNGVAMIVKCLTDNKNRTASDVRHVFSEYGGHLGTLGCVSYLFDRKGVITIDSKLTDELAISLIDAGAEDFEEEDGSTVIYTTPSKFEEVMQNLKKMGIEPLDASIDLVPKTTVKLKGEAERKVLDMIEKLEDLDDVQEVYSNFDIPENIDA